MQTAGASTPPTLDGLHLLGVAADSWEIVETELVGTIRMANGATREQRLAPDAGAPVIRRWYTIILDYRNLGPLADQVEALLAFPGPHQLTVWKHVTLGYLADGTLREWSLPWRLAPHILTPPAGAPASRFASTVQLAGSPLAVAELATAAYTAGSPPAGAVWFDRGSRRFKLSAPPAAGTRLVVQAVPLFDMVVGAEDLSRRYRDPIREPRRIVLVETELP
jgi:hypothetical protein